ncbi:MAG: BMC domain-containing protein, partial [Propionibacterium sp.]|nr:BMC domain-containing protein [Propionibacterium sp.]
MQLTQALGTIEVLGLPAAITAADVACKAADVRLVGYETTDGMGMVTVKITGQVSAVQSAIAAARAAAS